MTGMAMAEGTTIEQEDVPRAPPPSPELPHQHTLPPDFTHLLNIDSLNDNSPSSSTEHSRPTSPFFYPSPDHNIHRTSGSISPLLEQATKLSELSLSTPAGHIQPDSGSYHVGKELICGSLPVNGMDHSLIYHQSHGNSLTSDFGYLSSHVLHDDDADSTGGERRRKISLKRHHCDHQEEYFNDTRSHGIEIKKLCHEKDCIGSGHVSHARRSHTFSGSTNMSHYKPEKRSNCLSGNPVDLPGSLPGVDHLDVTTRSRAYSNESHFNAQPHLQQRSSGCLSPRGLKTIGFATNGFAADEQMEGIETVEEREETPASIPISVTHMDWSGGALSLTSNATPTNNLTPSSMNSFSFTLPQSQPSNHTPSSFSFNLTVPGFVSDSCPHNGFLTNQNDSSVSSQIPLDPHHFSKSL